MSGSKAKASGEVVLVVLLSQLYRFLSLCHLLPFIGLALRGTSVQSPIMIRTHWHPRRPDSSD